MTTSAYTAAVSEIPSRTRTLSIEAFSGVILAAVAAQRDTSLIELAELLLIEHGASFGASTVRRCLDRHGMTSKKSGSRSRARTAGRRSPAPDLVRSPA